MEGKQESCTAHMRPVSCHRLVPSKYIKYLTAWSHALTELCPQRSGMWSLVRRLWPSVAFLVLRSKFNCSSCIPTSGGYPSVSGGAVWVLSPDIVREKKEHDHRRPECWWCHVPSSSTRLIVVHWVPTIQYHCSIFQYSIWWGKKDVAMTPLNGCMQKVECG